METITLGIAITIILAIAGSVWKLATYIRSVEKAITNDTHHDLLRLEEKLDRVSEGVHEIKEEIASCPLKRKK